MNEQLGVCLLNDSFPPVIDGVATAVLNYARVITDTFGSAVVATPRYPGACGEYPYPVIRYPSVKLQNTAGYRMGLPIRAVRNIKKHQVDVIHSHSPAVSAFVAKSLRRAVKAPVILTYHTKFDVDIANAFGSGLMRGAMTRMILSNIDACDEVWAVSRGAGNSLRAIGYTGDYYVMPNGVDFPKGAAAQHETTRARNELGIASDMPVFLFVGRMMWYKGIKLIIDGLAKVKARRVPFKMVFIGGGTDYEEILAYAQTAGIAGDCIFTGPETDRERLRVYYSMSDLFLFPSTFDTSGIVVHEAAACGLASALIRSSSASDGIKDGVTGMLIGEDAESLARAAVTIAKNRVAARALGERAMDALYMPWEDAVKRAYERYCIVYDEYRVKANSRLIKTWTERKRHI